MQNDKEMAIQRRKKGFLIGEGTDFNKINL